MKQKKILIIPLILALVAIGIYSCKKQDSEKLTVESLIKKYDLKVIQPEIQDTMKTDLVFTSASDADAFIASIKNASYSTEMSNSISANGIKKTLRASGKRSGLEISGKVMFSDDDGDLEIEGKPKPGSRNVKRYASPLQGFMVNVNWAANYQNITTTGDLFGFTLGSSFTQTGPGSSYYDSQSGLINFSVHGLQNYNIFVEGIGTIYSQPIVMTGSLNPVSGNSSMTVQNAP